MTSPDNIAAGHVPTPPSPADSMLWWLSMFLSDNTLDVLLTCPMGMGQTIHNHYDLSASGALRAFEDVVYGNDVLLNDYARTTLLVDTRRYMVVPATVAASVDPMMELLWPDDDIEVVTEPLPAGLGMLAMGVDSALMTFVRRSFTTARVCHRLMPLVSYCVNHSRKAPQVKVYANIGRRTIDIVYLADGRLRVLNTFAATDANDMTYYIMLAATNNGFDFAADHIALLGDTWRCQQLAQRLSPFTRNVQLPPVDQRVPVELTMIPLCV